MLSLTPETKAILLNKEAIAIDQDKAGRQGKRMWQAGEQEIWIRELADGDYAIGAFNRGAAAADITLKFADLGIKKTPKTMRDVWEHKDVPVSGPEYKVTVPSHGAAFFRIG